MKFCEKIAHYPKIGLVVLAYIAFIALGLPDGLPGALLLIWNPFEIANLLAVALIGYAIAPIFPALMSGTSQRMGMKFAANTIGFQMAATGPGTVVLPSLLGVLARRFSLEIIPICLAAVFIALFVLYGLSMKKNGTLQENVA